MAKDSELERAVVMVEDLNGAELHGQLLRDLECALDDVQPLDQVNYSNVALPIALSLTKELITEATCRNFLHEPLWEVLVCQVLLEHHECHLGVICGQIILLHDRLDVSGGRLADLELQLISCTKLVLDVLDGAEALENATFDHYSHLCG